MGRLLGADNRLGEAQQAEVDAFYARWSGTYVEDRLRNDWLLELGKRRDWANFAAEYPRFRMNDDREVTLLRAAAPTTSPARTCATRRCAAWLAQRDADDGCALLAAHAGRREAASTPPTSGARRALAIDASRPRAARQAAVLLPTPAAAAWPSCIDNPARYLAAQAARRDRAPTPNWPRWR